MPRAPVTDTAWRLRFGASVVNGDIVRARSCASYRLHAPISSDASAEPARRADDRVGHERTRQWILRPFHELPDHRARPSPDIFRKARYSSITRRSFVDELRKLLRLSPASRPYCLYRLRRRVASKFESVALFRVDRRGRGLRVLEKTTGVTAATSTTRPIRLRALRRRCVCPCKLAATLATYNESGRSDRPALRQKLIYALGPVKSYSGVTDGGLESQRAAEVLRGDGDPFPASMQRLCRSRRLLLEGHGHHWAGLSFPAGLQVGTRLRSERKRDIHEQSASPSLLAKVIGTAGTSTI